LAVPLSEIPKVLNSSEDAHVSNVGAFESMSNIRGFALAEVKPLAE